MQAALGAALPILALSSVGLSLGARVANRGAFYPGWDLIGPTHGHFVLSTRPLLQALADLFNRTRLYFYWNHSHSLLYTGIPGALESLVPWEYWGHLLTLVLFVMTLALIRTAAALTVAQSWLLLLAWGASPALLSFSVAGYPYITGFLPHVVALLAVSLPRLRASGLGGLIAGLAASELSRHVYEAGKTFPAVLLAAAATDRSAPARTRVAWLLASAIHAWTMMTFPGQNVDFILKLGSGGFSEPLRAFSNLGSALFVAPVLDLPILTLLGVASLFVVRHGRWPIALGLAVQFGTMLILAEDGAYELRPRRYLALDLFCLMAIASAYRESGAMPRGRAVRALLIGSLAVGNLWQISDMLRFFETPVRERRHALPFTSSELDYATSAFAVDASRELRSRVESGEKLIVLYNLSAYAENPTDPAGALERLYLSLGHRRFEESVFAFGSQKCRYCCLPIRSLDSLRSFLEGIAAGASPSQDKVVVYYMRNPDTPASLAESVSMLAEIRRHFLLEPERAGRQELGRLRLGERQRRGWQYQGFLVEIPSGTYEDGEGGERRAARRHGFPLDVAWLPEANPATDGPVEPLPFGKRPFTFRWASRVSVHEPGRYELLVGLQGRATARLDGRSVVEASAPLFAFQKKGITFERGVHSLAIEFQPADHGAGQLVVDLIRLPH